MTLPGSDAQPFAFAAAVGEDRAVRIVFGPGRLDQVAAEARTLGTRIMIIAGRHEAEAAETVSEQLGDDLAWRISEVAQHVPVKIAERALQQAQGARVGVLVSIGGGSATGLAKAVARDTGLPILAVIGAGDVARFDAIDELCAAGGIGRARLQFVSARTEIFQNIR